MHPRNSAKGWKPDGSSMLKWLLVALIVAFVAGGVALLFFLPPKPPGHGLEIGKLPSSSPSLPSEDSPRPDPADSTPTPTLKIPEDKASAMPTQTPQPPQPGSPTSERGHYPGDAPSPDWPPSQDDLGAHSPADVVPPRPPQPIWPDDDDLEPPPLDRDTDERPAPFAPPEPPPAPGEQS